jgi:hypothetical protein
LPKGSAALSAERMKYLQTIFAVVDDGDVDTIVVRFTGDGAPVVGKA